MFKNTALITLAFLSMCVLVFADVNGEKTFRKNAVYTFTAFAGTDTTTTVDLAGAGDSFAFEYVVSNYLDSIFVKYEISLDGSNWVNAATPDTLTADGVYRELVTNASTMKYLRFIAESDSTFAMSISWKPGE